MGAVQFQFPLGEEPQGKQEGRHKVCHFVIKRRRLDCPCVGTSKWIKYQQAGKRHVVSSRWRLNLLESVGVAGSECCLGGTRNIHNPSTTHSLSLPFLATAFGASVCSTALPISLASYLHAYAIHPIPRYQTFPQFFSLFTDL